MDLISGSGVVVGLYDAEWKRKITKVLRSLELQKKEKESYAEMHYDRKRDNKMDKKAEVIDRLRAKLVDLPAGGRQKALIKRIAAEEQQMEELSRKYDAKKDGILRMMEYLQAPIEDVVVFGDDTNDLVMFDPCWTSIAMGNGKDELKKKATYVTDTNVNDGIEKACRHFGWI